MQAPYTGSFASHISNEIMVRCFDSMKLPVRNISAYDVTPPMAYPLEVENMPNPDRIARSIRETVGDKRAIDVYNNRYTPIPFS